ncbi:MAG: MCE family protein [Ignavibacteria bacterium]|jgi:phospholipid/cholesterol/gamma-HCH transport system substrate-binding protein|nr:MCE family protein [Ignavibacteria bacterium]MCU7498777.1 MCE family protein [Ignavibacteria bacterium]MCU7512029.1 MCE family protein [Ignavibacteria bacterium]MCU7520562.1 MCE family protein [Ignavibacteria bacterium]MCU7523460.1 MCE family protein [Ignavibacteria bacterium]
MSNEKNISLRVGFTVLAGLIVLFIFAILVGTNEFLFSRTYTLYIKLSNTAGLVAGAPVTLAGYKVGDVRAVEFVVMNNQPVIRVNLRIKTEYKEQIRSDSKVRITSIGILGDKFVDVSLGNPGARSVPEGSFLEVEPTFSLDNLAKNITPNIEKFNSIIDNIKSVTDSISKGKGTLGELINNRSAIAGINDAIKRIDLALIALENKKGSLGRLLHDSTLYNGLSSTALNLKKLTEGLNRGKGTLGKMIASDSLYSSLVNSSGQLNRFISKAQNDSTVFGGLVGDKKLYRDINLLIQELNSLISDIKTHPEKYVKVSVF